MDTETERPRRGRPPMTVTLTIEELATLTGITPSGVSKRIERGQLLETPRRYGLVKDVTDEPKRKPADPVDPAKDRDEVVGGLLKRLREPGSVETPETALVAAYNAGVAAGRNAR